jgi:flagellar motor switch protein FliN/FliY
MVTLYPLIVAHHLGARHHIHANHQVLRLGGGAIIELNASEEDAVSILANNLACGQGNGGMNGNLIAANMAELLPRPLNMR